MSPGLIAFIIFIVIIVIVVIIFAVLYSRGKLNFDKNTSTNNIPIPPNALKYGDMIKIRNTNPVPRFNGFLEPCGTISNDTCSDNVTIVPTELMDDTQKWQIISANGNATGTAVRYGEMIRIRSTKDDGNLGYCGSANNNTICGTTVGILTVSDSDSSVWSFGNLVSNSNSDIVTLNSTLEIINNDNNKLYICGSGGTGCGINVTNRNSNEDISIDGQIFSRWNITNI